MARQRPKRQRADTGRIGLSNSRSSSLEKKARVARRIKRSFWVGLALALFLAGVNRLLEKTEPVRLFEQWFYDVLQLRLASALNPHDLPVIVLDISDVPVFLKGGSGTETITQRAPLREIVDAVLDKGPTAIAIDLDFSPDAKGYAAPDDDQFLEHLLQSREQKGVPIFVGVNESLALGPEQWLLKPRYISLASCIVIPTPEKNESTRRLPEWLELHYKTKVGGDYKMKCYSIGAATAQWHIPTVRWWARPFVRTTRSEGEEGDPLLSPQEFLVDYSPLDALSSNPPRVHNGSSVSSLELTHKVVFLGRCRQTNDTFTVPGRPQKPYPGVFLHAAAAYTLLQKKPLYFLTSLGRWTLDLFFATLIFGSVLAVWSYLNRKSLTEDSPHVFHSALTVVVLLVLFLGAVVFVRSLRLMWDDFLLVAAALLMHSPLERNLNKLTKLLRGSAAALAL